MKFLLSKNLLWLCLASALLIFAIRFFENGFNAGQLSVKLYITLIGIIFLGVGAFAPMLMVKSKNIVPVKQKHTAVAVKPNGLLTDRECEILEAVARGLTNKQIGEALFVSENTVKKHINNIYFKLDVNRRTQAIARAKQLNILSV